jgi:6-phosphogluconate dehydrogenase
MCHNGIEYGDMQLIAEAYDLLKNVGGLTNAQLKDTFDEWNKGELRSFLIEITSKVINFPDPAGGHALLDVIQDKVGMKGTGTWTIQAALNLQVAAPTMAAAVDAREMSGLLAERVAAEKQLPGPKVGKFAGDIKTFVNDVKAALYCSKICSYAQGMAMLAAANQPKKPDGSGGYDYGMHLDELAKIWRAGCIIRADFLDDITKAFQADPHLANLLLAGKFKDAITKNQEAWRRVVGIGVSQGIATPAFSASLAYYDAYRRARLPGNLIQAQRDFFGGHTYMRTDKTPAGPYHMEWAPGGKETLVVEGKSRTK